VKEYNLNPCPFCGNKMDGYPNCTITFKHDKRKVWGIYHEICTIHCNGCGCTIQQAGCGKDGAEENASKAWNRRASDDRL